MFNKPSLALLTFFFVAGLAAPEATAQSRSSGTKAVVVEFPTGGAPDRADFLYFLSAKRALNLGLGFTVEIEDNGDTRISTELNLGYRMYGSSPGRAMPYLEPFVGVDIDNLGADNSVDLEGGARLGVEYPVYKQFTLGAYLAATVSLDDSADRMRIGLSTGAITAAFYWD